MRDIIFLSKCIFSCQVSGSRCNRQKLFGRVVVDGETIKQRLGGKDEFIFNLFSYFYFGFVFDWSASIFNIYYEANLSWTGTSSCSSTKLFGFIFHILCRNWSDNRNTTFKVEVTLLYVQFLKLVSQLEISYIKGSPVICLSTLWTWCFLFQSELICPKNSITLLNFSKDLGNRQSFWGLQVSEE